MRKSSNTLGISTRLLRRSLLAGAEHRQCCSSFRYWRLYSGLRYHSVLFSMRKTGVQSENANCQFYTRNVEKIKSVYERGAKVFCPPFASHPRGNTACPRGDPWGSPSASPGNSGDV